MTAKPRLLDLFCGAGGAAMGYYRAGFDVVGVDIKPQPRYQFEFHQGDALEYCAAHGYEFDVIHASPPCQAYSVTRSIHGNEYPDLVAVTRAALQATGKPWVIENVVGAPLFSPLSDFSACSNTSSWAWVRARSASRRDRSSMALRRWPSSSARMRCALCRLFSA